MSPVEIRLMKPEDYPLIYKLWKSSEGIGLSEADSESNIRLFLEHNPGLCYVACESDHIVGAVLCGEDGRRGYLHHLAVLPAFRRRGIGGRLVSHCLESLARKNIQKCHIFIFRDNHEGIDFWENEGWSQRDDLKLMSKFIQSV
jgi:ribosomal protein S18 acetylase RimI-like enzyme